MTTTPEPVTDADRAWVAAVLGRRVLRHRTTGALGWSWFKTETKHEEYDTVLENRDGQVIQP